MHDPGILYYHKQSDEYYGVDFSDEGHRWRYSRPPSPRTSRSSGIQDSLNSSWCDSQGSEESLPPLPPRGILTEFELLIFSTVYMRVKVNPY